MKPKYNTAKLGNSNLGASLVTVITVCLSGSAFAADNNWIGTTTDWNTPANWSLGVLPTAPDDARISTNTAPIATITSTPSSFPRDLIVGRGAGNSGRVDHRAGILATGNGNWGFCGHEGGTGVYNLADTSAVGGSLSGWAQGSGTLNVGGQFRVGGGGGGTLNVNTSGTINVSSELHIGTDGGGGGNGVMNLDFGTITNNGWLLIGNEPGSTGVLNVSGGQVNKGGGDRFVVGRNQGTGTINLGGSGSISANGWLIFGAGGSTGNLNMTGGTFTKTGGDHLILGDGGGNTGNIVMNGGTLSINNECWIGQNGGAGNVALNSGTINSGSWVQVGRGGTGTVNMTGGTWNKTGGGLFMVGDNGNGTFIQSGGTVNVQSGDTRMPGNGTANFTLSAAGEFNASLLQVATDGGTGNINLNGGTLRVDRLIGGNGTENISFNGTQIIAKSNQVAFMAGIDAGGATIDAGGLRVNSNGFNINATSAFDGDGGVEKSGAGTLTLSGMSSYGGTTSVVTGKLVLNGDSTGAGAITVANGATLGINQNTPSDSLDAASATFGTTGATTLEINLGNVPGNPDAAALNAMGNLSLGGTVTINIADSYPALDLAGFPLIQFGSRSGAGTFVLGTLPPGVTAHLDETTPGFIKLVVTQALLLEWDDSELTGGGVWNTINTNWNDVLTSAPAVFQTGAPVSFLDVGTVDNVNPPNPNVVIAAGGVSPGSVIFNNSSLAYSITGAGGINGSTGLLKQGTGTVTLGTSNGYTGVTRIEAGTVSANTLANGGLPSSLGAASSAAANLVLAGSTLEYTGGAVSIDRGLSVAGANDGSVSVLNLAGDVTTSGQITASLGKLHKSGPGTLTLTGSAANVLANGNGDETVKAFSVLNGGVVLNGVGQTNTVNGRLGVGTAAGPGVLTSLTLGNSATLTVNGWTNFAVSADSNTTVTIGGTSEYRAGDVIQIGQAANAVANVIIKDSGKFTKFGGGWFSIGNSSNAVVTMTVRDSGTLTNNNNDLNIGDVENCNGTLNLEGAATVTSGGNVFVGKNSTHGTLTMSGTSTMSCPETDVGGGSPSVGMMTIGRSGVLADTPVYTQTGRFLVGRDGGSTGTLTIQGTGKLTVGSFVSVGMGGGGTMIVRDSGSFSNTDDFSVNESGDVPATVTVRDNGTFTTGTSGTGHVLYVGRNENRTGTLNIQGAATVTAGSSGGVVLANSNGSNGTVNLDGGTLITQRVSSGAGNSTFIFQGGVLKAGPSANLDFLSGLDTANVGNLSATPGNAVIDSNGQTIAINQALSDGGGNLIKQGAGTLLLNGANSYFGDTQVVVGTLGGSGSVSGRLLVAAIASVNPGATVGTFSADSAQIDGTYVCEINGANADQLAVGGALTISPGAVLNFSVLSAPTAVSSVIATFSSITGSFAPQNVPAGFQVVYSANSITLDLIPTTYTTWATNHGLNPLTDGAPGADPDSDGQANEMEFALGGSPVSGSDNAKIYTFVADSSDVGSAKELLITIAVRDGGDGVGGSPVFSGSPSPTATQDGATYTVQGSTTLGSFTTGVTPVAPVTTGLPAAPSGYEYRTFSLNGSDGTPGSGFLRVKVSN